MTKLGKHSFRARLGECIGRPDECWNWPTRPDRGGYGKVTMRDDDGRPVLRRAHREVYRIMVGEIPEGMQIDHLCRNPRCVNPRHLEVVTPEENLKRMHESIALDMSRTHCKRGHELSEPWYDPREKRWRRLCRKCAADRRAADRARRRAASRPHPKPDPKQRAASYPRNAFGRFVKQRNA